MGFVAVVFVTWRSFNGFKEKSERRRQRNEWLEAKESGPSSAKLGAFSSPGNPA